MVTWYAICVGRLNGLRDSLDKLVSGSIPQFELSSLNSALVHHTMAPRAAFGTIKSICELDLGHVKLLALKPDPRTKILPSNFLQPSSFVPLNSIRPTVQTAILKMNKFCTLLLFVS